MQKRVLGRVGIEVSEIAFGTVSLGIPYGIGVRGQKDMLSEQEAIKLLQVAFDKGVNFFDTARSYGFSEERIGKAFKGKRENIVIATKCCQLNNNAKRFPIDVNLKKIIDTSLSESLSSLRTDYIDVFMIHDANISILSNQIVVDTFSEYKRKGIVRAIGVSTYDIKETQKAIEMGVWDVIQLAYNLMDQRQGQIFTLAEQADIGIVVRSVLLKGILTSKGQKLHPNLKEIENYKNVFNELLSENILSLSDLAIKFVLSHNNIASILVGIDKSEYLESALAAADGNYLDDKTLSRAKQLAYPEPKLLDLHKWDIRGWLK